ncbi:MAG: PorV/PorQ family protein [Candidatus Zixiibacteriota bacterium]
MKQTIRYTLSLTIGILVLLCLPLAASETGMIHLLNLTGARQVAMGEVANLHDPDPFNLEYNPATITGLEHGRAGFSHNEFFLNWSTNSLAIIFPAAGYDFGVHLRVSSIGDIEARDETPTTDPLYLFDATDFSGKAFIAKAVTPRLHIGASAGLLLEKIDVHRATALALGLGAVYKLDNGLAFHGSMANIGGDFSYISQKQSTPKIFRAGAGYHRKDLTLSADYVNIKSGDGHIHVGGEYFIDEMLFVRAGYQTGYDTRDISAGAGFVYNNLRIDYAFVPYKNDLGTTHRFALTIALR